MTGRLWFCCSTDSWQKETFYLPERPESAQQTEHPEDSKDAWTVCSSEGDNCVNERDEDESSIDYVPTAMKVWMTSNNKATRKNLHTS